MFAEMSETFWYIHRNTYSLNRTAPLKSYGSESVCAHVDPKYLVYRYLACTCLHIARNPPTHWIRSIQSTYIVSLPAVTLHESHQHIEIRFTVYLYIVCCVYTLYNIEQRIVTEHSNRCVPLVVLSSGHQRNGTSQGNTIPTLITTSKTHSNNEHVRQQ